MIYPVASRSKQRGLSYLSLLGLLAVFAAIFLVVLKLYPLYFDQITLVSIAEGFQEEPGMEGLSEGEVERMFRLRMQTNGLDIPLDDHVFVYKEADDSQFVFETDYERRVNIYKNIDAVVVFKDSITVKY